MNHDLSRAKPENDIFEITIDCNTLSLNTNEIELTLGYPDNTAPSYFIKMIEDVISKVPEYCEVKAGYRLLDVEKPADRHDGLYVAGKFFNMDKIVTSQLKKSEKAALFVCTIGTGLEQWSKQEQAKGDPVLGYIIDTVASSAVENAANVIHDHISEQMKKQELNITNRYSPGYCNWPVSEQHLLFSLLPENFCGISLTDSALMLPIKSISGIIGIGKNVKWADYLCDRCGVKDCTHRITRISKAGKNIEPIN